MLTIDQVVVSMTLNLDNNNSETPRSCSVERILDDESLARKYLTLSIKVLAVRSGQSFWDKKIREVGQSFWDGGSRFQLMRPTRT